MTPDDYRMFLIGYLIFIVAFMFAMIVFNEWQNKRNPDSYQMYLRRQEDRARASRKSPSH
tara:strand:+ start:776 stop:955 length:180 start_codon:yes stop_codon:yes gene_type:complete